MHNTFTFTAALILFRCLQRVDYSVLYAFTFNAGRISRGQVLARCVLRVGCSVYNAVNFIACSTGHVQVLVRCLQRVDGEA